MGVMGCRTLSVRLSIFLGEQRDCRFGEQVGYEGSREQYDDGEEHRVDEECSALSSSFAFLVGPAEDHEGDQSGECDVNPGGEEGEGCVYDRR